MRLVLLMAGCLGAGLLAHPAHGQGAGQPGRPLSAFSRQTLDFGTLFPGAPSKISRFDALHAGQFELRGAKGSEVRVDLALPAALTGPRAARVPLQFGAADGGFAQDEVIATAAPFDPSAALVTTLSGNGRLYVFLGGTARPGPQQSSGTYGGSVTVTIAYTGI